MTDLTASSLRALKLMDLTTLNDDDTNEKVIALCHQAKTPVGNTAAICIYPRFIPIARKTLKEQGTPDIRIATVTNFPHGNDDIEIALAETRAAIAYGADEVDVVFPYRALIAGNEQVGFDLVKACKDACAAANVLLKVIIETGELKEEALIRILSEPKNALIRQYQKLLGMDNVELVFEEKAVRAIAKKAIERNTGARGLRAIIEKIMTKVMYEIPGMKDVVRCTVTEDTVLKGEPPLLERKKK